MDYFAFYDYCLSEITFFVKAKREAYEQQIKEQASLIYTQSVLTGLAVGAYNPWNRGKIKIPKVNEIFPFLIDKDEKPKQQDWRIAKDRLLRYAEAHNKKRGVNK